MPSPALPPAPLSTRSHSPESAQPGHAGHADHHGVDRSRRRLLRAAASAPAIVAAPALLSGCGTPAVADYAAERPLLDLRRYFDGEVLAHGIFVDRSGKVQRRFTVTMMCRWSGPKDQEEGELDERFVYSDGSTERRVWRLKHHGGGRYTGRADDVEGVATGQTAGNSFRWNYTLRLPVDGRVWEVQFDDWMHLVDDRVLLNRATMSKFGLRLGEVQLAFTRATPQRTASTHGQAPTALGHHAGAPARG